MGTRKDTSAVSLTVELKEELGQALELVAEKVFDLPLPATPSSPIDMPQTPLPPLSVADATSALRVYKLAICCYNGEASCCAGEGGIKGADVCGACARLRARIHALERCLSDAESAAHEAPSPSRAERSFLARLLARAAATSPPSRPTDEIGTMLEVEVPFDNSVVWEVHDGFYQERGGGAWNLSEHGAQKASLEVKVSAIQGTKSTNTDRHADTETVPFGITSNDVIALQYARVAATAVLELVSVQASSASERGVMSCPLEFNAVELGAGHGEFSLRFMSHFLSILSKVTGLGAEHGLRGRYDALCKHFGIKLRYIVTDYSERSLLEMECRKDLHPFIECGFCDFAVWDAGTSTDLRLRKTGEIISPASPVRGGLFVIGNYFFDSLRTRFFRVTSKECMEVLVSSWSEPRMSRQEFDVLPIASRVNTQIKRQWTPTKLRDEASLSQHMSGVGRLAALVGEYSLNLCTGALQRIRQQIKDEAQSEARIDALLRDGRASEVCEAYTIPLSEIAMTCIHRIRSLAHRDSQICFLVGDKGFGRLEDCAGIRDPHIASHSRWEAV